MGKEKLIKICNIVAFIFALSFVLQVTRDAFAYGSTLNSAPFYVWVLVDAVRYLMPALCIFLVGRFFKFRLNQEKRENPLKRK
ncbi:MAG: hypothetical protein IJX69_05925 [Oscillospiraceae bacterium]|nr:hypothetical protein [Oscillospiraceae bacterium]